MNKIRLNPVRNEVERIKKALKGIGKNEFVAFVDKGVLTAFSCFRKMGKHKYVCVNQDAPKNAPEAFLMGSGMKGVIFDESDMTD